MRVESRESTRKNGNEVNKIISNRMKRREQERRKKKQSKESRRKSTVEQRGDKMRTDVS